EPYVAVDEVADGEGARLRRAGDDAVALPLDPVGRGGPGAGVLVLAVVERVEREVAAPLEPPGGVDDAVELRLHEHRAGVLLPGAAEVGLEAGLDGEEVGGGGHLALLDGDAGVLVGVLPPLRGVDVALVGERAARVEVAALEDDGGVAEDEVDGAVDVALAEELAEGVDVEGVLVADEAAPVERRQVGAHAQRHRLVLRRAGRVLDRQVAGQEVVAHHSCTTITPNN
ncbi:Os01g0312600, partial [Oryza sativa Japonica Group]